MVYGTYEIVQVLGDMSLITSTWRTCQYAVGDKQPLRPGFYLVLWPAQIASPDFDKHAQYVGPLPSKKFAEKLKTSALSLGLIVPHSSRQDYGSRNCAFLSFSANTNSVAAD